MTGTGISNFIESSALAASERRRGLEIGWIATLIVTTAALGASWMFRAIELDLSLAFRGLFVCAVAAIAIDAALHSLEARVGLRFALEAGHAQKIVWLAVVWHLLGGIHNPLFLFVFFLPLLAAGVFLMRRYVLVTAGLSAVVVVATALLEAPGLRWYLVQLGLPLESLLLSLPQEAIGQTRPFVSLETGPEFQFVVLVVFVVALPASALVSILQTTRVLALVERFRVSSLSQHDSGDLFRSALREDPVPTVLVYPDSGQIVEASRSFTNQMLVDRDSLAGKTVFDCLSFSDSPAVRALLTRRSGELSFVRYRIGTETRIACVRCYRIRFEQTDYARMAVLDLNELSYLSAVSDALEDPLVVIRDEGDVAYFNAAARALCPAVHFGMSADRLLDGPAPRWWIAEGDLTAVATVQARAFRVESVRVRPDGGSEALWMVRLRAVDPGHASARPEREARAS